MLAVLQTRHAPPAAATLSNSMRCTVLFLAAVVRPPSLEPTLEGTDAVLPASEAREALASGRRWRA